MAKEVHSTLGFQTFLQQNNRLLMQDMQYKLRVCLNEVAESLLQVVRGPTNC